MSRFESFINGSNEILESTTINLLRTSKEPIFLHLSDPVSDRCKNI